MGGCTRRIQAVVGSAVLLLRIHILAGRAGGAAAAVSQQGLELSKNWPSLRSRDQVYMKMKRCLQQY